MKILSAEELMHTGPAAMREYCKALGESLRDATEENAELREALRNIMAQLPRKPYFRHEVDEQARARKLLGADDDKPS